MRCTRTLTTLAVAALLAAGCAGGDGDAEDHTGSAPGEAAEEAVDATGNGTTGDADTGADTTTAAPPRTDLTAQDGFNGPLDADADHAPGTGMVTFGGEEIALAVECINPTGNGETLFLLRVFGEGEDADGNRTTAEADRQIYREPERFYDYGGQEEGRFVVGRYIEGMFHHGAVASPADNDRTGANLPIVRVLEDGRFSAVAEMRATSFLEHAPDGLVVFTGRCQEGWDPLVDGS